jgi:hypothetical protein
MRKFRPPLADRRTGGRPLPQARCTKPMAFLVFDTHIPRVARQLDQESIANEVAPFRCLGRLRHGALGRCQRAPSVDHQSLGISQAAESIRVCRALTTRRLTTRTARGRLLSTSQSVQSDRPAPLDGGLRLLVSSSEEVPRVSLVSPDPRSPNARRRNLPLTIDRWLNLIES